MKNARVITLWRQTTITTGVLYTYIPMPETGTIVGAFLQVTVNSSATGSLGTWLTTNTQEQGSPGNGNDSSFAYLLHNHQILTAVGAYLGAERQFVPAFIPVVRNQLVQWGVANSDGTGAIYIALYLEPK